jgi:hypothetical protein
MAMTRLRYPALACLALAACGTSAMDPQPGDVVMSAAELNGSYVGTVTASSSSCFRPQTTMRARINGAEVTGDWEGGRRYSATLSGNGFQGEVLILPANGGSYRVTVRGKVQPGGRSMAAEFYSTSCTFSGTLTKQP